MTMFSRMIVVFAGVSLCVLIGVGCGGDEATQGDGAAANQTETERPAYKAPPTNEMPPMASDIAVTIQEELKVKQELPDYYPEDGPLYPDTLPSNIRVKGSKVTMGFGTADPADQVADYLESDLQSKGWTVLPVQEVPTGSVIQGSKDGRNVTVLVSHLSENADEYATMIMVSVQR